MGIAILAFAMGMVHALTPGHGKIVLFSYFLGHQAKPWAGMLAAAQLSLVHVTTAVLLVTAIGASAQAFGRPAGAGVVLQGAGAALVTLSGYWMLWKAVRGTRTGAHQGYDHNRGRSALPLALGLLPSPLTMLLMTSASIHTSYWLGLATVAVMAVGIMSTIGTIAIVTRRSIIMNGIKSRPLLVSMLGWPKSLARSQS